MGGIHAIEVESGKRLWSYERPNLGFGPPALTRNRLFTRASDGFLYAFGTASHGQPPADRGGK